MSSTLHPYTQTFLHFFGIFCQKLFIAAIIYNRRSVRFRTHRSLPERVPRHAQICRRKGFGPIKKTYGFFYRSPQSFRNSPFFDRAHKTQNHLVIIGPKQSHPARRTNHFMSKHLKSIFWAYKASAVPSFIGPFTKHPAKKCAHWPIKQHSSQAL